MQQNNYFKNAQKIETNIKLKPYRTIGRRIVSAIIDSSIIMLAFAIVNLILFFIIGKNAMPVTFVIRPILLVIYNIIMVKICGGTLGKLASGIKVLTFKDEINLSWFQSIRREIINMFTSLIVIYQIIVFFSLYTVFSYLDFKGMKSQSTLIEMLEFITVIISLIEIFTALFNEKRRSLHDFIGGSVVKKVKPINRKTIFIAIVSFIVTFTISTKIFKLFN